jgi:hypothetical protein
LPVEIEELVATNCGEETIEELLVAALAGLVAAAAVREPAVHRGNPLSATSRSTGLETRCLGRTPEPVAPKTGAVSQGPIGRVVALRLGDLSRAG